MDTWFTQQPLIKAIVEQGLDVIGMVKNAKQRYQVGGQMVSLKELYQYASPLQRKKGILRSITTTIVVEHIILVSLVHFNSGGKLK